MGIRRTTSGSLNPSTAAEVDVINILPDTVAGAVHTLAEGSLIAARSGRRPKQ
jgi:hypothetical protein